MCVCHCVCLCVYIVISLKKYTTNNVLYKVNFFQNEKHTYVYDSFYWNIIP